MKAFASVGTNSKAIVNKLYSWGFSHEARASCCKENSLISRVIKHRCFTYLAVVIKSSGVFTPIGIPRLLLPPLLPARVSGRCCELSILFMKRPHTHLFSLMQ